MNVRIGLISDVHWKWDELGDIEPCDLLLCAGDISGQGRKKETLDFIEWYENQWQATHKIFIAGNHELTFDDEPKPDWLIERLANLKNDTYYLEDSGMEIWGIKIWGTPWQPEFHNWAFNLPRGRELAEKYALIPPDTDILISHGPPYGIEDTIPWSYVKPHENDNHVGCRDLLSRIKELRLKLHVFGHIHLDGREEITPVMVPCQGEPITCVNAAVVDNAYQITVKPYYFNLTI